MGITETPDRAVSAAETSDARIAAGEARPLEGIPLAIKDLFCTKGTRTTAASKILGNFVPPYESTVTQNLWNEGAVMLGAWELPQPTAANARSTTTGRNSNLLGMTPLTRSAWRTQ